MMSALRAKRETPSPFAAPVLQLIDLSVGYPATGRAEILRDINLSLETGFLACVVGPNGAGKSTLLRAIAGLQPAQSGEVRLLGQPVLSWTAGERARNVAVVMTGGAESGYMTVRSVVALGRYPYASGWGRLRPEDNRIIELALRHAGVAQLAGRPFAQLSDGERQKVFIARALAQDPILLVLDEPTAYLDVVGRAEIMHALKRLSRTRQHAIVVSTHDLELALRMADWFWLVDAQGGVTVGAPEDLALDGSLGRVFAADGCSFDGLHGGFHLTAPGESSAHLDGVGPAAEWTRRALRRMGYAESRSNRTADVSVTLHGDTVARGVVMAEGRECEFGSIAQLAAVLSSPARAAEPCVSRVEQD